jgi:NAD(P)-dependent dehydrogenase (short-subunit alcohol dehydrogenase family)
MRSTSDWTPASIPDLGGRLAVVTGGNSGIGYATSLALAEHGARVVLACRDPERAGQAARALRDRVPAASIETATVDLADLRSVREFAARLEHPSIDLLVNNAGLALAPLSRTADGFETHFGVNHLGTFALTGLLLPRLLAAPAARVVTVSSEAQRYVSLDLDDPHGERRYRPWLAYLRSKKANVYFAAELQRRATAAGARLCSVAASPGLTRTNVLGTPQNRPVLRRLVRILGKPPSDGAAPVLYAATTPLPHGGYVVPGGLLQQRGAPTRSDATRAVQDAATAARLWRMSEVLTGVCPDFAPRSL